MPELPEVETIRRGLAAGVAGRRVASVEVLHPRPIRRHLGGQADLVVRLVGQRLLVPRRRGKFLWLPLPSGDALMAHLGMSGQFRLDAGAAPRLPHTRVVFGFDDDDPELRFVDQRMFGGIWISPGGADAPPELAHVGLDPFDPGFDARDAAVRLRARHSGVKRVLLDQSWVSGIGNIYADEALWRARLHFAQPADSLSARKANELVAAVTAVMAEAIEQGGTSFDALYINVNGESGYFDQSLDAYGREDLPCKRCGTPMVREQFTNRSSTRCPRCQRLR